MHWRTRPTVTTSVRPSASVLVTGLWRDRYLELGFLGQIPATEPSA